MIVNIPVAMLEAISTIALVIAYPGWNASRLLIKMLMFRMAQRREMPGVGIMTIQLVLSDRAGQVLVLTSKIWGLTLTRNSGTHRCTHRSQP